MDVITIGEGVFEQSDHRVDVVFRHFTNVFKYESEGFETTVSDIEFGCTIFVQDGRDTRERTTCLGDNGWRSAMNKKAKGDTTYR
jgi:hypothetical protein